jgi:diacylglycerol kinase (ATP)
VASSDLLLLNPAAARGAQSAGWLRSLTRGADLELVTTTNAREMTALARRAAAQGADRVLVAGGDGAMHHAIQGLVGTDCALGVIPIGTGNDLARALGSSLDPRRAAEAALSGTSRRIDLGRIGDRYFVGVAGLGFDTEVNEYVREHCERLRGRWAYPWAVLRTLGGFEPPLLRVEHDAGAWEGRVVLAALANSPFFGGGMRIAPAARLDDGLLDLIIVERISKLRLLCLFPRVYSGSHVRHPRVRTLRTPGATLRADRELTFFADGEPLIPVSPEGTRVEICPRGLAVIAPAAPRPV